MRHRFLLAIALAIGAVGAWAQAKPVIAILSQDSPLYGAAVATEARQVDALRAGDPVRVIGSQDRRVTIDGVPSLWYQVELPSSASGWIPGSRLSFTATAFPRSAFRTVDQYAAYLLMAARPGDRVVAARSYEKVRKGDTGYYVSYHEGGLPLAIVWERNLEATPSMDFLPEGFPPALVPFVYYVEVPIVELLGDQKVTPLAELATTLPTRFPSPGWEYAEAEDEPFPWYLPAASYVADGGYDDGGYDDYDGEEYGDSSGEGYGGDDEGYYAEEDEPYVEGEESYGRIEVGSLVILGKHDDVNGGANWAEAMERYVGTEATVTSLPGPDSRGFLVVRVSGNGFAWRVRNLALKNRGDRGSYGYDVGDRVILGAHRFINDDNNWAGSMRAYVGQEATITSLEGTDGSGSFIVHVDVDEGAWYWRVENMRPAE